MLLVNLFSTVGRRNLFHCLANLCLPKLCGLRAWAPSAALTFAFVLALALTLGTMLTGGMLATTHSATNPDDH